MRSPSWLFLSFVPCAAQRRERQRPTASPVSGADERLWKFCGSAGQLAGERAGAANRERASYMEDSWGGWRTHPEDRLSAHVLLVILRRRPDFAGRLFASCPGVHCQPGRAPTALQLGRPGTSQHMPGMLGADWGLEHMKRRSDEIRRCSSQLLAKMWRLYLAEATAVVTLEGLWLLLLSDSPEFGERASRVAQELFAGAF